MALPNTNYSDLTVTTLERRTKKIQDNVRKNNALLMKVQEKAERTFSGGTKILEPLSYRENGNFSWYSGGDTIAMSQQDVISTPEYPIKQAATGVVITGLEDLQNSGPEAELDLLRERIDNAESTMANKVAEALYSDGTGYGGKQLTGLLAAVPVDPTTGTYGNIDRSTTQGTFWRSQVQSASGFSSTTVVGYMNALWMKLVRGKNQPKLGVFDNLLYAAYMAGLQPLQRFTDAKTADAGFTNLLFMGMPVVLDGGIGGFCPDNSGWFLNTDFLHWRPHSRRNFVPLSPKTRVPFNQDLEGTILAFAGNLTCSGAKFQGFLKGY